MDAAKHEAHLKWSYADHAARMRDEGCWSENVKKSATWQKKNYKKCKKGNKGRCKMNLEAGITYGTTYLTTRDFSIK